MFDSIHSYSPDVFYGLLRNLSFKDLCRAAQVNRPLNASASSDRAWGRFFPTSVDCGESEKISLKPVFKEYYEQQLAELISSLNDLKGYITDENYQWGNLRQEQRATLQRLLAHSISNSPINLSEQLTEFNSVFRTFSQQYPTKVFEFFQRLEKIESVSSEYKGLLEFFETDFNVETYNDIYGGFWPGSTGCIP